MEQAKVSVIIPVYNVENYLEEALNSVMEQSFSAIEIICINDGSTDQSGAILDRYALADSRIKVYAQANKGLSATRNAGLKMAAGEYLYFFDSDDKLHPKAIETLYTLAKEEGLDVLCFDGEVFGADEKEDSPNNFSYKRPKTSTKTQKGEELFMTFLKNEEMRSSVCLMFIKRAYLVEHQLSFFEGIFHEDNLFAYFTLLLATRAKHSKEVLFYRRLRSHSIMTGRVTPKHLYGYYVCYREILAYLLSANMSYTAYEASCSFLLLLYGAMYRSYQKILNQKEEGLFEGEEHLKDQMLFDTLMIKQFERTYYKDYSAKIKRIENDLALANSHIQGIMASPSYKVGRAATFPLRFLRDKTGKTKRGEEGFGGVEQALNSPNTLAYKEEAAKVLAASYQRENPLVSVVLPCYNVADYIEQALESLLNQSLKNVEIIFVDDGSTDETPQMIKEYQEKHPQLFLFRQKNQYAGVARNVGLSHAKGKYVIFLDPDDFFAPDLLERACAAAEGNQAEVVFFSADIYNQQNQSYTSPRWLRFPGQLPQNRAFTGAEMGEKAFHSLNPWTKLYLRSFIEKHHIQYQSLYSTNDAHFSMMAIAHAQRICAIDEVLVHYRTNTGSNLQSTKEKSPNDVYEAFLHTKKELEKLDLYKTFETAFVAKALESMFRQLDTLKTFAALEPFYTLLQMEGFKELGIEGFSAEGFTDEMMKSRYRRYRELKNLPFGEYLVGETLALRNEVERQKKIAASRS